jgi:uncharacterized protein YndB with AHSA1/START domain
MYEPAVISIDRSYALIPAATVWRALTDSTLVARWWVTGDLQPIVGHRFELDMGAWGKPVCEVLEVVPERLFRFRFTRGSVESTVTWQLSAEGDGTRLRHTHGGFDLRAPGGQETYDALNSGWPLVLARLATVLVSPT